MAAVSEDGDNKKPSRGKIRPDQSGICPTPNHSILIAKKYASAQQTDDDLMT
jgi:hypothetical protein